MSFLLNTLITLLALAAAFVILPTIPLSILRFGLRGLGWFIQKRTRSRKEFIISRVRADEEEFQSKRAGKSSPSTSQAEDEDWEKVDTSTSSVGPAGNNGHGAGDENWDGIIGFFHPFWYGFCGSVQYGIMDL